MSMPPQKKKVGARASLGCIGLLAFPRKRGERCERRKVRTTKTTNRDPGQCEWSPGGQGVERRRNRRPARDLPLCKKQLTRGGSRLTGLKGWAAEWKEIVNTYTFLRHQAWSSRPSKREERTVDRAGRPVLGVLSENGEGLRESIWWGKWGTRKWGPLGAWDGCRWSRPGRRNCGWRPPWALARYATKKSGGPFGGKLEKKGTQDHVKKSKNEKKNHDTNQQQDLK